MDAKQLTEDLRSAINLIIRLSYEEWNLVSDEPFDVYILTPETRNSERYRHIAQSHIHMLEARLQLEQAMDELILALGK